VNCFVNIHYMAFSIWLANSAGLYGYLNIQFGGCSYHMSWDFSRKAKDNHKSCVCMAACVIVGVWVTPMCHFNSLWTMSQLVFSIFHACWMYIIMLECHLCLISQSALFGCRWNQLTVWLTQNSTTKWQHILGYHGAWLVHINCQRFFILLLGSPCFGVEVCIYMSGHHVIDTCLYIHICALSVDPQLVWRLPEADCYKIKSILISPKYYRGNCSTEFLCMWHISVSCTVDSYWQNTETFRRFVSH
jgi:hypothetical protein